MTGQEIAWHFVIIVAAIVTAEMVLRRLPDGKARVL